MSNWCDVRMRLKCRSIDAADALCTKMKKIVISASKYDKNASIFIGSDYFKPIWTSIKRAEDVVYVLCNFRVGLTGDDFADIVKWFYPSIDSIELQARDDDSKVFSMFKWRADTPNQISVKMMDPEQYPELCEDDREMVARLHEAIKKSLLSYVPSYNIAKS